MMKYLHTYYKIVKVVIMNEQLFEQFQQHRSEFY